MVEEFEEIICELCESDHASGHCEHCDTNMCAECAMMDPHGEGECDGGNEIEEEAEA